MSEVSEIQKLRAEIEQLTMSRDSFRDACQRMRDGRPVEIRMQGGELDEIVGHGGFHVEQMDDDEWFFDLGGCAFFVSGKGVKLTARDYDTWDEAKAAFGGAA